MVWPVFPEPLVRLLAHIMAVGERLRIKAHALGTVAATLVEGSLRDSQQQLLWSAAWTEVRVHSQYICSTNHAQ